VTDPMDLPPPDHGSDRYDYVEIEEAPADVQPRGDWFERLLKQACPDCRANLFVRWLPDGSGLPPHPYWAVKIAHDDTCPTLARMEQADD